MWCWDGKIDTGARGVKNTSAVEIEPYNEKRESIMREGRHDSPEIVRFVEKTADEVGKDLLEVEKAIEEVESILELLEKPEQEYTYLIGKLNPYLEWD